MPFDFGCFEGCFPESTSFAKPHIEIGCCVEHIISNVQGVRSFMKQSFEDDCEVKLLQAKRTLRGPGDNRDGGGQAEQGQSNRTISDHKDHKCSAHHSLFVVHGSSQFCLPKFSHHFRPNGPNQIRTSVSVLFGP